ncbi:MAG: K(+)-transporting ATPase subunit F [Salinivirgaceae bacterium]|jgi:K+-transporting ATPase KdpF subunit
MNATILLATPALIEVANPSSYVIGAVIALCILGYLLYSLVNPEKF